MSVKNKIGIEAEFLLRNAKGELIVPPASWDRDGFPLLGEIRADEAEDPGLAVANFVRKKMEILARLNKGHSIQFTGMEKCPLALYRKANKEANLEEKQNSMGKVRNINGIDIEEFSDQIVSKNKIQGIRISCGLHIHFSSEEYSEEKFEEAVFKPLRIPIQTHRDEDTTEKDVALANTLLRPEILLYKNEGWKEKKVLKCRASRLNKPAILYIIKRMDDQFFNRFAPPAAERTKFRQPGFFELKPHGFEYRSLPMTAEVEANLLEISVFAFDLLKEINEYEY